MPLPTNARLATHTSTDTLLEVYTGGFQLTDELFGPERAAGVVTPEVFVFAPRLKIPECLWQALKRSYPALCHHTMGGRKLSQPLLQPFQLPSVL